VAAPEAASHWSAFYFAAGGGAGKFDQSSDFSASKLSELWGRYKYCPEWEQLGSWEKNKSGSLDGDDWNGFGTIQIGADHLLDHRFLIGAFADIDFYRNSDNALSLASHKFSFSSDVDLERVWSVGGRIGVLAHPNFLIYAVGGYTQAQLDGSANATFGSGPYATTIALDTPDKLRGFFVGAGGEWMIHDNLSLKLEYRYAKYRDESSSGSASKSYSWEDCNSEYELKKYYSANANFDADIHSIRGALVLRLGRDESAPAPLK
jgi:opacity protein-like surface antigen